MSQPSDYRLHYGTHATADEGRCAMEWVAHLAGEPHSDQPACVSPVLRAICIALNDGLDDGARQRLRPYLARTIGTAEDGLDPHRAWLALDWLIRTYAPAWLAAAGLSRDAARLHGLEPIASDAALEAALPALDGARRAARDQLSGPVHAPWDAVRSTARETAWSCSGAAAWAASRVGVGAAGGDRARADAQAAAADAAVVTARSRIGRDRDGLGRAAQKDLVRTVLGPVLQALDLSAVALLDRMLPREPLDIPAPARVFTLSV